MTDQTPCVDLLDIGDVSSLLGCTQSSTRTIIRRSAKSSHPFPEPCIVLGNSPGWLPDEVHSWVRARPGVGRGPRPNRKLSDERRLTSLAGDRDYLTPRRMATFLGVTVEQLSRMRSGAPKPTKAGAYIRYMCSDIQNWLDAQNEDTRRTG